MIDQTKFTDKIERQVSSARPLENTIKVSGRVNYELFDEFGQLKQKSDGTAHNLVTTQGDKYFVNLLSTASAASIKLLALGTGTANVAKADTWVSGYFASNGSAATGWGTISPTTNSGTPANLQLVGTFAAGNATQNGITRVIYTNMNPAADGNGTPTGTSTYCIAHGTVSPTVNKAAGDTLVITWDITFLGS